MVCRASNPRPHARPGISAAVFLAARHPDAVLDSWVGRQPPTGPCFTQCLLFFISPVDSKQSAPGLRRCFPPTAHGFASRFNLHTPYYQVLRPSASLHSSVLLKSASSFASRLAVLKAEQTSSRSQPRHWIAGAIPQRLSSLPPLVEKHQAPPSPSNY
ncbi:hypothetical protein N658DRAFT_353265 [Parathielavia hyrcaniae]|uniref:Uncharacterized protein n=1 Tax=Parathielavia hyrcaniae TaxID=113614 RepID=A0AAN6T2Z3_9PEZI|nr:hypothetical protein N658DRAFT_353265 [Parathielavia hyrcaniae]